MHFARICAAVHCCWSLCEQQILKLFIAVTQAFFQADFDTAALINEGCFLVGSVRNAICQDLCCNALLLVSVRATSPKLDIALTQACCQAVVCIAAMIEGCILLGSVLQCTVAGHYASSKFSNSTLQ